MEHIFFEVQLCIEMLIFKEQHVFPILIILCLGTSVRFLIYVREVLPSEFLTQLSCPIRMQLQQYANPLPEVLSCCFVLLDNQQPVSLCCAQLQGGFFESGDRM